MQKVIKIHLALLLIIAGAVIGIYGYSLHSFNERLQVNMATDINPEEHIKRW